MSITKCFTIIDVKREMMTQIWFNYRKSEFPNIIKIDFLII